METTFRSPRRRRLRITLIPLLVLALAACESFTDPERWFSGLELVTERGEYAVGQSVELWLYNGSPYFLLYNLCFTSIEAQAEGRWVEVGPFGIGVCAAVAHPLGPGSSVRYDAVLQEGLQPGPHRLRTSAEIDGIRRDLTAEFSVGVYAPPSR